MKNRLTNLNVFSISKHLTIFVLFLSLGSVIIDILLRVYAGNIIDNLNSITNHTIIQIIIITLFYIICKFFLPYFSTRLDVTISNNIKKELEEKVLKGRQEQIEKFDVGKLSTFFTSDISGIIQYVNRITSRFIPDMIMLTLGLITIFIANHILGIITLLTAIIPAVLMIIVSKKMTKGNIEYQNKIQQINTKISNDLYNLEYIKSNQIEDNLISENEKLLSELLIKKKKLIFIDSIISSPAMFASFLTTLIVSVVGGYLVTKQIISIGILFTIISLLDFVISPIMSLGNSLTQIRRVSVNLKRLNDFLIIENESEKAENYIFDTSIPLGSLIVKNISFDYNDKKIFKNYSTSFHKGTLNVIIGENGAGKSTLLKILSNIYDVQNGCILTNSNNKNVLKQNIRELIIFDPQEPVLVSDTILRNLTLDNPFDIETVYKVCESVGIHSEILSMGNGYESILNINGEPLSGGQKRRICLARSLLRKGKIYIFDEPTTGIDQKNIEKIITTLNSLALNNLVIVISHEKLLIQSAKTVVKMEVSNEE